MEVNSLNIEKSKKLIQNLRSAEFVYAKTYPTMPHYYTVGRKWESHSEFLWTCHAVKALGKWQYYMSRPRNYFYVDGWQYWIMSDDPNDCKILNRAREGLRKPQPIPKRFL